MRISRRTFLWSAAAVGGGLALGIAVWPRVRGRLPRFSRARTLGADAWLNIRTDGSVTLRVGFTEMGQGVHSALAQAVAEELEVDWSSLRVEQAPPTAAFDLGQGHWTGGSTSLRRGFDAMLTLGAAARTMLLATAATRWSVDEAGCRAEHGRITHAASGRSATYGELADEAAQRRAPSSPARKPREQWRVIGKPVPRLDVPAKVDGSAVYGIDVRVPDMLVAAVAQSPAPDGKLSTFDRAAVQAVPGVTRVIDADDLLAVVAERHWPAERGLLAAAPQWSSPSGGLGAGGPVREALLRAVRAPGPRVVAASPSEQAVSEAFARAAKVVEADYFVPFVAHAQLEPVAAVARVEGDRAEFWVATQSQSEFVWAAADELGIPARNVELHTTLVGGGFGRRLRTDEARIAARLARELKRPVKIIFSREEDFTQAHPRPAVAARMRAALAADGRLLALDCTTSSVEGKGALLEWEAFPYGGIPWVERQARIAGRVRTGAWRSVGHSYATFFIESLVDECARTAGVDPIAYRKVMLAHDLRMTRVLDTVAGMSSWTPAPPASGSGPEPANRPVDADRHLGVAICPAFGSLVAQVAEVEITPDGHPVVRKVYAAVDCGTVVDPRNVEAQIQGGILFGLSAALYEQVDVRNGATLPRNYDDYPILTMAQAPPVEVRVLETPGAALGGIGEVGVPPIAAAVANAMRTILPERCRSLPLLVT